MFNGNNKSLSNGYTSRYINTELLTKRCKQSILSFSTDSDIIQHTKDGVYYFIDNKSPILAIAHLDTVENPNQIKLEGEKFYAPTLDDRLGVHLIMDVLPSLMGNCPYDILLTEGEEVGRSTAKWFMTNKKYNWMFEIDRMGLSSVMYQYETPEYRKMLTDLGFLVGIGSATDIKYLERLEIFGVNFACAYYNNHSVNAFCNLRELDDQIEKILSFIQTYKDTYLPHEGKPYYYSRYSGPATGPSSNHNNGGSVPYYNTGGYSKRHNDTFGSKVMPIKHMFDGDCPVCNGSCSGLETCSECELLFHSNIYVALFGVCEYCLRHTYKISWELMDGILSGDSEVVLQMFNAILEELMKCSID